MSNEFQHLEAIKNMELPATAPNLDLSVDTLDMTTGRVKINVLNRDNNKTTTKEYESMDRARSLAIFIAGTLGVSSNPIVLNEWLEWRGFPPLNEVEEQKE